MDLGPKIGNIILENFFIFTKERPQYGDVIQDMGRPLHKTLH